MLRRKIFAGTTAALTCSVLTLAFSSTAAQAQPPRSGPDAASIVETFSINRNGKTEKFVLREGAKQHILDRGKQEAAAKEERRHRLGKSATNRWITAFQEGPKQHFTHGEEKGKPDNKYLYSYTYTNRAPHRTMCVWVLKKDLVIGSDNYGEYGILTAYWTFGNSYKSCHSKNNMATVPVSLSQ